MGWWQALRRRTGAPAAAGGLPGGLWQTDFARIDRAASRFVQVSSGRPEWDEVLAVVLATRAAAWQRCVSAAAVDPRSSPEVPGDPRLAAVHRALAQAAVQCAQAAQAVVMAGQRDHPSGGHSAGQPAAGHLSGVDTAAAARAAARALALLTSAALDLDPSGPGLS